METSFARVEGQARSAQLDEFLEPFWNLEQVRAWVESRDPELVRFAAIPKVGRPRPSLEIVARCIQAATTSAKSGRDVGAELWNASGWTPPSERFATPPMAQKLADDIGFPAYLAIFNTDVQIRHPKRPHTDALLALWIAAPESEGSLMNELVRAYSKSADGLMSDPRLAQLSPELRRVAIDYFSAPEPHGPPYVFIRGTFPTIRYLEHLFRTGALSATANLPGEPKAYELTKADWAGLELACGGDSQRLGVWRIGKVSVVGGGDFENGRVDRELVLSVFPAEAGVPRVIPSDSSSRPRVTAPQAKPTLVQLFAEELKQRYPDGRPGQKGVKQLARELELQFGTVAYRTLRRAIAEAWPGSGPPQAK
jgi:hypothetical protein